MSEAKHQLKRAVVYLRTAVAAQASSDSAIAQQRQVCQSIADRLNAEIVEEYVEVGSGTTKRRPVLERMLDSLDARPVHYLIVSNPSRLTRSFDSMARIQERLRSANTALVTDTSLTPSDPQLLAKTIKGKREALGISASELARRAGVQPSTITRIEAAQLQQPPQPENVIAIARALDMPASDLFAAVDWLPEGELPTFKPYLRTKYRDLPPDALAELEASFARMARRHGYRLSDSGPAPGEDET